LGGFGEKRQVILLQFVKVYSEFILLKGFEDLKRIGEYMAAFTSSKKALSPILATLLIIVIVVAATAVTFAWVSSSIENTTQQAGVFLYEANVAFVTPDKITVAIGNSGTSDTEILAVYFGESQATQASQTTDPALPISVPAGQVVSFNITYPWTQEVTYYFKISSTAGQQVVTFQQKATETPTSASPSPTSTQNPTTPPTTLKPPIESPVPTSIVKPTTKPTATPTVTPGIPVTIRFAASGLVNFAGGTIVTIDGGAVDYWDLSWKTFNWVSGETHTVTASTPLEGYDHQIFRFSSWTNGNGLTEASGTFTVPAQDTTVTVNYVKTSVTITFATNTLPTLSGGVVLTIDGTGYDYWDLPSTHFIWETGTTHSVVVSTPLNGWDGSVYTFTDWTNGDGLTGASGTYTTPASDATVTANYDRQQP
jgi:flagellin-like protein